MLIRLGFVSSSFVSFEKNHTVFPSTSLPFPRFDPFDAYSICARVEIDVKWVRKALYLGQDLTTTKEQGLVWREDPTTESPTTTTTTSTHWLRGVVSRVTMPSIPWPKNGRGRLRLREPETTEAATTTTSLTTTTSSTTTSSSTTTTTSPPNVAFKKEEEEEKKSPLPEVKTEPIDGIKREKEEEENHLPEIKTEPNDESWKEEEEEKEEEEKYLPDIVPETIDVETTTTTTTLPTVIEPEAETAATTTTTLPLSLNATVNNRVLSTTSSRLLEAIKTPSSSTPETPENEKVKEQRPTTETVSAYVVSTM